MGDAADLQEELAPEEVARLHEAGEIQLVDVRETYEHQAGHIAGARHIEMDHLAEEAGGLAEGPPVVFYCRVGNRSGAASQAFRASGLSAHNLAGGLVAWVESGLPLEPEDGEVAPH